MHNAPANMGEIIWDQDTSWLRPLIKASATLMCMGRSAQHEPPEKTAPFSFLSMRVS